MPPPPSSSNLTPPDLLDPADVLEDDRHISQTRQIAEAASDADQRISSPTPLPGKRAFAQTLVTSVAPPPTERTPNLTADRPSNPAADRPSNPAAPRPAEAAPEPNTSTKLARPTPPPLPPRTRSNPGFAAPPLPPPPGGPAASPLTKTTPLPAPQQPPVLVAAPTFGPRPTPPPPEARPMIPPDRPSGVGQLPPPQAIPDRPSGVGQLPQPVFNRPSWPGPVAPPRDQPSWTGPIAAILGHGDRVSWTGNMPAPPQPEEYAPGHIIAGKFRLTRLIGRGGMGAVWLAQNMTLDIDVAVKLIRRDKAAPAAAMRLLQEARAAARLNHPSIVRVYEFGETQWGDPFIAMEFLHGESLDTILTRKGRLAPATA
ncbi:MAG: protein kinase, partial [Polyangiaceae bacterium]|nr:protein kinase [Polyangiaceae bacterium]